MNVMSSIKKYLNYINGEWVSSESEELKENVNPAQINEIVGYVQQSSKEELDKAVEAAKNARSNWRKLTGAERGNILYKTAEIMESRLEEIAETLTREMGKPFLEAKGETARGIAILRYYAGEGLRKTGDVIPATDNKALMYTDRVPVGVVGLITPWNFPVAIPLWKLAPALIYGNTVVIKPAGNAEITSAKIVECLAEAGIPKGVVNLVFGRGSIVGERLIKHPDVSAISFTGSNRVGQQVAEAAVARGAKYQLEMGGKNPLIVANDADIEQAVEATVSGAFRSTGQKCTATSRVIVESGIYEEFKQRLIEKTKEITIGNGMDERVWMGPSVSEEQLNTVLSYIDKGKAEGATLVVGGKRPNDPKLQNGFFIEPTIFEHVHSGMTIAKEEIFGPVVALMKVDSIAAALEIANHVVFGLSASIFTKNIESAFEFIDKMDAGLIRVNFETAGVELQAPFGGMKDSSVGSREQGEAAKEFFTTTKTFFIKP